MTIQTVMWAWKQDLPCAEKFVMVTMCDIYGMSRFVTVEHADIGKRCGLPIDQIPIVLRSLQRLGMLQILSENQATSTECRFGYPIQPEEMPTSRGRNPSRIRDDAKGWLYVLDGGPGVAKIGITESLDARIRALSNASGLDLKLAWFYGCTIGEARRIERAVLEHTKLRRTLGEWFANSVDDVIAVAVQVLDEV